MILSWSSWRRHWKGARGYYACRACCPNRLAGTKTDIHYVTYSIHPNSFTSCHSRAKGSVLTAAVSEKLPTLCACDLCNMGNFLCCLKAELSKTHGAVQCSLFEAQNPQQLKTSGNTTDFDAFWFASNACTGPGKPGKVDASFTRADRYFHVLHKKQSQKQICLRGELEGSADLFRKMKPFLVPDDLWPLLISALLHCSPWMRCAPRLATSSQVATFGQSIVSKQDSV